jgi:nitrogen regulatory protein PII-like uncharacterized protein
MLVPRKKIEIFVEEHAVARIERMLADAGFKGWSVLESAEGAGSHGAWRQTGVDERGLLLIVAIGGDDASEKALAWLGDYFKSYPGIVAVSDVAVLRGERF